MLRPPFAYQPAIDEQVEAHLYDRQSPRGLERLEQRELAWRGRPEWVIRKEMEAAVARRFAQGRRRSYAGG
jgi:hypothetical protein